MSDLRCVIWDVDGTLVNSRAAITRAMQSAFEATRRDYPGDAAALSGVGLSIDELFLRLVDGIDAEGIAALSSAYKQAYYQQREALGARALAPFFDGARDALDHLGRDDWTLMGVATGKSRRGLTAMIAGHGLEGMFQSTQTADDHPSKPHPSMIEAILRDTGVDRDRTVMVGDTSFDIEMGKAAGVRTISVSWGYHAPDGLGADHVAQSFDDVVSQVDLLTGRTT